MGIRNLAFCDAEVVYPDVRSTRELDLDATMKVLRWKKIDLVSDTQDHGMQPSSSNVDSLEDAEDEVNQYSPSVLSKTAYRLITEEVLSVNPDIILIEKQRWRSGGGSAVQQWTVRVNTLEAMLWAILETLRTTSGHTKKGGAQRDYRVYAVDPKRVGQYWLSRHARALEERDEEALAADVSALSNTIEESDDAEDEGGAISKKKPSRSKAEKSAKIALLRSWLADTQMSTNLSTPSSTPQISFTIAPGAEPTRQALLPKLTAPQRKRKAKTSGTAAQGVQLVEDMPITEIKKLDDITDCFLQAAAWVAWELNRVQLMTMSEAATSTAPAAVDEPRILKMLEGIGHV